MRAVTTVADDATAALDLSDIARGDGFLFVRDGVGLAGRGVAARVPPTTHRRRWPPSSTTTAPATPAVRWRWAGSRTTRPAPAS